MSLVCKVVVRNAHRKTQEKCESTAAYERSDYLSYLLFIRRIPATNTLIMHGLGISRKNTYISWVQLIAFYESQFTQVKTLVQVSCNKSGKETVSDGQVE